MASLLGVLGFCAVTQANIVIDTVPVGNPGNPANTTSYCAVGYIYRMGTYEVTAGQYTEFLNAVAATDTYGLYNPIMDYDVNFSYWGCNIKRAGSSGAYSYSVPVDWVNRPVNFVSWGDAARFANWMNNGQPTGAQGPTTTEDGSYYLNGATSNAALRTVARKANATWVVPSEDEWYKAAYHKNDGVTANYFIYPTRSNSAPGNQVINPDPGNSANFFGGSTGFTIGPPYYRTEVGEFENSSSPYGTFDQGGNVWEWNEAVFFYGTWSRGLRGGSFITPGYGLLESYRYGESPTNEQASFGFRLALVPEPATLALLILGGLAILRWRR